MHMIPNMARTGILVHGLVLGAKGWENMIWGHAPDQMGRIPKAIQESLKHNTVLMYFGSGNTKKDGLTDGQIAFKTLVDRQKRLLEFTALKRLSQTVPRVEFVDDARTRGSVYFFGRKVDVVIDKRPCTTVGELRNAAEIFTERGIEQVVLVSSATHVQRCLRDAIVVFNDKKYAGKYKKLAQNIIAVSADTGYNGASADDVVIFEPPHRPDRPSYPLHHLAKGLFRVNPKKLSAFGKKFEKLVGEHS